MISDTNSHIYVCVKIGRRDAFGINPMEGESEPDEMEENVMANTAATSTFFPGGSGGGQTSAAATATSYPAVQGPSSRRAPVMGNRGLESQRIHQHHQERSRSKSKSSSGGGAKDSSRSRGSPRTSRKSGDSQVVSFLNYMIFGIILLDTQLTWIFFLSSFFAIIRWL